MNLNKKNIVVMTTCLIKLHNSYVICKIRARGNRMRLGLNVSSKSIAITFSSYHLELILCIGIGPNWCFGLAGFGVSNDLSTWVKHNLEMQNKIGNGIKFSFNNCNDLFLFQWRGIFTIIVIITIFLLLLLHLLILLLLLLLLIIIIIFLKTI